MDHSFIVSASPFTDTVSFYFTLVYLFILSLSLLLGLSSLLLTRTTSSPVSPPGPSRFVNHVSTQSMATTPQHPTFFQSLPIPPSHHSFIRPQRTSDLCCFPIVSSRSESRSGVPVLVFVLISVSFSASGSVSFSRALAL